MRWLLRAVELALLAFYLVFAFIIYMACFYGQSDSEPPDFASILARSGIPFAEPPIPVRWARHLMGPGGSDEATEIEFKLADGDADLSSRCADIPGYARGLDAKLAEYWSLDGGGVDLDGLCWREARQGGINMERFAISPGVLRFWLYRG